jgi:drug/metabolite transporter (DMT)-like permease
MGVEHEHEHRPAARGTWLAVLAAMVFGVTTPAVQRAGAGVGPFATAALLYLGAAAVAVFTHRSRDREARVRASHAPRILAIAALGAFVAPVALAWGLGRTSGVSASLMLNVEAVFTVILARMVHKEHVGARVAVAVLLIAAGSAGLAARAQGGGASAIGLAAVALASLAWAADNVVAKPLSQLDPAAVVLAKGAVGASLSIVLALVLRESVPAPARALVIFACGAAGYGLSLRLYILAQRRLGAARTGSIFAAGPFFGAVIAWSLGQPFGTGWELAAAAAIVAGVALHLTEKHEHAHVHEEIEHEHAHRHDDGHHDHRHDVMPEGEHSHVHRHTRLEHAHPHVPDVHHEHDHE